MNQSAAGQLPCLCGSGVEYQDCCARVHQDIGCALSAEQLMRARYVAMAMGNMKFIADTGAKAGRSEGRAPEVEWLRLEVLQAKPPRAWKPDEASVEFKAYYQEQGVQKCLHERSKFRRMQGVWWYVGGKIQS